MNQESRIKRWRSNKHQQGLKHVSVWLTPEEELRLKDLAILWRCSPSEVVQRALAQISTSAPDSSSSTDTLQIRRLILAELEALGITISAVRGRDTAGITVGPTDILAQHTSTATTPERAYEPEPGHSLVTEPAPQRTKRSQTRSYG